MGVMVTDNSPKMLLAAMLSSIHLGRPWNG